MELDRDACQSDESTVEDVDTPRIHLVTRVVEMFSCGLLVRFSRLHFLVSSCPCEHECIICSILSAPNSPICRFECFSCEGRIPGVCVCVHVCVYASVISGSSSIQGIHGDESQKASPSQDTKEQLGTGTSSGKTFIIDGETERKRN